MNTSILAVDDDPDVLQFITMALESGGFSVITAGNGTACLAELQKGFKGLILLDIMMPGMSGWDVVKKMVDSGLMQGNLVCMLTAKYSVDPVLGEFAPWVIEYIRKPFEPKTLLTSVRQCLACLER